MKTLFLVRHAKARNAEPGQADRERPLHERGQHDAKDMGERLALRGVRPDVLLSSPALRARSTAERIVKGWGEQADAIAIDERIYASSQATLLAIVRALDDRFASAMVFGHNPEFSELALRLSGGEITDMPTCGVAELQFDVASWAQVGPGPAAEVRFERP